MEKIISFSYITIEILFLIIMGSISVIKSNLDEKYKTIIWAILNFIIYCLIQYSYDFIQWTIRLNIYHRYPYKNPFCILVIIYCIISLIILGIYYIKYQKNEYDIRIAVLLLLIIHVSAILLVMFFSPFNNWF